MKQSADKLQPTLSLRALIRNKLSRMIAAMRRSRRLQPLHQRYGPIKYHYVLPAWQRLKLTFNPQSSNLTTLAYRDWAKRCARWRISRADALEQINRFTYRPTISIILPVYNTPPQFLRQAIESVLNQFYPAWELCICDDGSSAPHMGAILQEFCAKDSRIKVTVSESNQGIARASNRALELATGDFIGLFDHDDELSPDALYEIVATLQQTAADLIYSDEDRLDDKGERAEPHFKPGWSPDLLLATMYLGHFCVYRKSIVHEVGGFRSDFDGSQDYDLALRVSEKTNKIAHIPKILYHWRRLAASASAALDVRPRVIEAGRRALTDALARRQIAGCVESEPAYGFYRVRRIAKQTTRVSIIIPTRDGVRYLRRCIRSIETRTAYDNYEILIIDNGSRNPETCDYLKQMPHRVLRLDEPFNFARLNNLAARETTGEYLLFLNDDTEVINPEWLAAMVEHAGRAEVGAVGAKLLYPDGRIQHAGILLGVRGTAAHAMRGVDGFSGAGYLNYANTIRNYNAVTAACLLMRRELFFHIGGFDEERFPVSYNDVDLCLRLREQGYRIIYTPYAQLYHHESATRGVNQYAREEADLRARWANELLSDCYYNPNLDANGDFSVDYAKPESLVCTWADDGAEQIIGRLDSLTRLGQAFSAPHDNLCAVAVRLQLKRRFTEGRLRLRLRESLTSAADVRVAELEAAQLADNDWCCFYFNPVRHSRPKRYYFFLEMSAAAPAGKIDVRGNADTGSHFENHLEAQGTMAFRVYTLLQFRYAAFSTKCP